MAKTSTPRTQVFSGSCPLCGADMNLRSGNWGPYYSCSKWPKCKGRASVPKEEKARLGTTNRPASTSIMWGNGVRNPLKPMPQQETINREVASTRNHICIQALAGCGKSTTMKMAMWIYAVVNPKAKILAATQGKRITMEFSSGSPQIVRSQTWHSFGLAQLRKELGRNPEVMKDKDKTGKAMDNLGLLPVESEYRRGYQLTADDVRNNMLHLKYRAVVVAAVRLCKCFLFSGTQEELDYLFERFSELDTSDGADEICYTMVPDILEEAQRMAVEDGIVDMTDMIYLPVRLDCVQEKFDDVVIDESQDLNKAQHVLAILSLAPGGRIIQVGDENQAIMAFSGADNESMHNFNALIKERLGKEVTTLPLTVSLRCTKIGRDLVRSIIPEFDVLPNAESGEINAIDMAEFDREIEELATPGTMITSRTNAPLILLAWKLIRSKIPVKVQGVPFADNIRFLIVKSRAVTSAELKTWIIQWGDREISKLKRRRNPGIQMEIVQDTVESIVGLCDETRLVSEVESILKDVFKNTDNDDPPENVVVLSSIHRAKGLEADHVICYPPHPPHPLANADWQMQQEINLLYVQWTRFKKRMTVVRNQRKGMLAIPTQLAEFLGEKPVMIKE